MHIFMTVPLDPSFFLSVELVNSVNNEFYHRDCTFERLHYSYS